MFVSVTTLPIRLFSQDSHVWVGCKECIYRERLSSNSPAENGRTMDSLIQHVVLEHDVTI